MHSHDPYWWLFPATLLLLAALSALRGCTLPNRGNDVPDGLPLLLLAGLLIVLAGCLWAGHTIAPPGPALLVGILLALGGASTLRRADGVFQRLAPAIALSLMGAAVLVGWLL